MFKNLILVSGLDEYSRRPECYALSTGKLSPTFRWDALPSSSVLFDCLVNKKKALRPFETTVGTEYPVLCNIPEERSSHFRAMFISSGECFYVRQHLEVPTIKYRSYQQEIWP